MPDFIAEALHTWSANCGITLAVVQPAKRNRDAYVARLNRSLRHEVPDAWVYTTHERRSAQSVKKAARHNTERLQDSLGNVPSLALRPRPTTTAKTSNFKLFASQGRLRPL